MKNTIITILAALSVISLFADYDTLSLPKGDQEITVDTTRASVMKLKELDVWSTNPDATVTVDRVRSITLYTNAYDLTYCYWTNNVRVGATQTGYMTDKGCYLYETYNWRYEPFYRCSIHPSESLGIFENSTHEEFVYTDYFLNNVQRFLEYDNKVYGIADTGVYTTTDFVTWENSYNILSNAYSVAWNDDKSVVVIGRDGFIEVRTSSSVVKNTLEELYSLKYDVVYGNGRFVAVGKEVDYATQPIFVSTDNGETWTQHAHPISSMNFDYARDLLFYNGLFVMEDIKTYGSVVSSNGVDWINDNVGSYCTYCKGNGDLYMHKAVLVGDCYIYKCGATATNYVASATFPEWPALYRADLSMACGNGVLALVMKQSNTNNVIYYTTDLDLGESTTWNIQETYLDGTKNKQIDSGYSKLVFINGKFLISNGSDGVLVSSNISDLTRVSETAKHSTEEYWRISEGLHEALLPNHDIRVTKIDETSITNKVWSVEAQTAYNTLQIAKGICSNGFLSQSITNETYLLRGDVIRTTGVESETEATRAVFIYEK